jgi:hypothetical protein
LRQARTRKQIYHGARRQQFGSQKEARSLHRYFNKYRESTDLLCHKFLTLKTKNGNW